MHTMVKASPGAGSAFQPRTPSRGVSPSSFTITISSNLCIGALQKLGRPFLYLLLIWVADKDAPFRRMAAYDRHQASKARPSKLGELASHTRALGPAVLSDRFNGICY